MRQHLAECADCREYYERYLLLAAIDPAMAPARERIAVGLGLESRNSLGAPLVGSLAAAAAAALLLVGSPWWRAPTAEKAPEREATAAAAESAAPVATSDATEFTARGAPITADPELSVYRVSKGGKPERAEGRIGRDDELAISYSNRAGYEYLMVFGSDEHGHVYWYYPAWSDANDDPAAIPIEPVASARELPDAVAQPLDGRELRLVALFTHAPLSVRQIEDRLKRSPSGRLGLPGSFELEQRLGVEGAP